LAQARRQAAAFSEELLEHPSRIFCIGPSLCISRINNRFETYCASSYPKIGFFVREQKSIKRRVALPDSLPANGLGLFLSASSQIRDQQPRLGECVSCWGMPNVLNSDIGDYKNIGIQYAKFCGRKTLDPHPGTVGVEQSKTTNLGLNLSLFDGLPTKIQRPNSSYGSTDSGKSRDGIKPYLPTPEALFFVPVVPFSLTVLTLIGLGIARQWRNIGPVWMSMVGMFTAILGGAGLFLILLIALFLQGRTGNQASC